jgi:hypothetical protein
MEATYYSETSVDFERTTWRYIPKERTCHNHRGKYFETSFRSISEATLQLFWHWEYPTLPHVAFFVLCAMNVKRMYIGQIMSVCLSACQVEKRGLNSDEIWCGSYATGSQPKLLFFYCVLLLSCESQQSEGWAPTFGRSILAIFPGYKLLHSWRWNSTFFKSW